jgi:hypothetical protein
VSRGRIGGKEGRSQSRVEGLRAALTGGGGGRRGLDEIQSVGMRLVFWWCAQAQRMGARKKKGRRRRPTFFKERREGGGRWGGLTMVRARVGGAKTQAACGQAAAAQGRRRQVAHEGAMGRERRERAGGLAGGPAHGVGPSCKREGERMASGPGCNSNKTQNNSNLFQLGLNQNQSS